MLQCDSECARRTLAPCTDSDRDTYRLALALISSCLSLTCGIVCVCLALAEAPLSSPAALFLFCFLVLTKARRRIQTLRSRAPAPRGNSEAVASHKPACLPLPPQSLLQSWQEVVLYCYSKHLPRPPSQYPAPYPTPPPPHISPQVCCLLRSSLSMCNAWRVCCRVTVTLFFNLEGVA